VFDWKRAGVAGCILVTLGSSSPSIHASSEQRVAIRVTSCDEKPLGKIEAGVTSLPGYVTVASAFGSSTTTTGTLTAALPPGNYRVWLRSDRCSATTFIAVLPGLDRIVDARLLGRNIVSVIDPTQAIAGRLPNGVTKVTFSMVGYPHPIEATVDRGAYYFERPVRWLYILRLEGKAPGSTAQIAVDLTNQANDTLLRFDISQASYDEATRITGSPFHRPGKIVFDRSGTWFLDRAGNRVGHIDTNGTLTQIDLPARESSPVDIVASDDAVWVSERSANKIARISDTNAVSEFPLGNAAYNTKDLSADEIAARFPVVTASPEYLAVGKSHRVWFTERFCNCVGAIDVRGTVSQYPIRIDERVHAIVSGPDSRIWAAGEHTVFAFDGSGTTNTYDINGDLGDIARGRAALWLSLTDNGILRMGTDGTASRFTLPLGNTGPVQLLEDAKGTLWFVDQRLGDTIGTISANGSVRQSYADWPPAEITDMAEDPDGVVWLAQPKRGLIQSAAGTGQATRPWYVDPTHIAFDGNGNLWFSAPNASIVGVIGKQGTGDCYRTSDGLHAPCDSPAMQTR
jgi:virginiamycin B lyase